ncbi:MAG: bifunctional (p)ppGpp synthetase/guanosine-3',5'-bis(diphosphate) 3'-pyrophosphohydrolase [Parcubacteria group bacterium]|nr:bifunctional (p)ppGpp synthetase/guanosine-3',5'-bis(diphosphate) 3'-pyrophosphohydrolase [Parcubacteria group bacterium]
MPNIEELIAATKSPTEEEKALIKKAYAFSERAHSPQKRFSGEPYFNHCFAVSMKLAEIHMDAQMVVAGLLHDTLEDAGVTSAELEKEFGKEIVFLVEGVTKLGKLKYRGAQRHVESLRKLFIAMTRDIRVLIIKFADRLHNVSTLEHVRPDKQKRIALETLEIYAPLANRLGMGRIRYELEEYSFPYAYPEEYKKVKLLLHEREKESEEELEKFYRAVKKELAAAGYKNAKTSSRAKGTYSLYKKLLSKNMDVSKVYDILAVRVIVPTVADCYGVLGIIHSHWRPLPGRIKDYIAFPKPNGYQSLHTTVFTGDGGIIEIQVRTESMHEEAEYGIASHLGYKEGINKDKKKLEHVSKKYEWFKQLVEWQKGVSETGEFMEHLKMDFFENRVFVFTPKGDVIDLPQGSSPIDFAYAIHSDIGDRTAGAKVNGKFVALDTVLKNGDIVIIETKKSAAPTRKWIDYAKTTLAKRHIRNMLAEKNGKK